MRRRWLWIPLITLGSIVILLVVASVAFNLIGEHIITVATRTLGPRSFNPDCNDDDACIAWVEFRREHSFPYQTIAARRIHNHITFVISEPPPRLSKSELKTFVQKLFKNDLSAYSERRWMIGEDGWLEDVVLTVQLPNSSTNPEDLTAALNAPEMRERIVLLHDALFGTPFGGSVEPIGTSYSAVARHSAPNLEVTASELYGWLHDPQLTWAALGAEGNQRLSAFELLSGASAGPFVSSDGRLVLFLLNAADLRSAQRDQAALESLRVPFRQFAVASDTIIGSAWRPDGLLALIGRARSQPLQALPPLRFETFQLLARETRGELQQSYERGHVVAGKMFVGANQLRDWAPIYLSGSLIDSEFGALLNITDQILKSYSEGGQVDYVYFQYPLRPEEGRFLMGEEALSDAIYNSGAATDSNGHREVLFNWNTSGSAVVTHYSDLSVLTSRHTGSLAVTYGAATEGKDELKTGGGLMKFEDRAYEYFSSLKDPNLARVVSYTLMYQGLIAFEGDVGTGSINNGIEVVPKRQAASDGLVASVIKLLHSVQQNDVQPFDSTLVKIYAAFSDFDGGPVQNTRDIWGQFQKDHPTLASDEQRLARLLANPQESELQLLKETPMMIRRQDAYNKRVGQLKERIGNFNTRISIEDSLTSKERREIPEERNRIDAEKAELESQKRVLQAFLDRQEELKAVNPLREALSDIAPIALDLDRVRADYVRANATLPEGRIKTPSAVVSWNKTDSTSTGGHNLTAHALRIEISPNTENLELVESDTGVVLKVNPKLALPVGDHASELARAIEHSGVRGADDLVALVKMPVLPRDRAEALELPQVKPAESWVGFGEGPTPLQPVASDAVLRDALLSRMHSTGADAVVVRTPEGYKLAARKNVRPPPDFSCCILMKDSLSVRRFLVDVRAESGGAGRVVFEGDTPQHVAALASSLPSGEAGLTHLAEAAGSGGHGGVPGETGFLSMGAGEDPPNYLRIIALVERSDDAALYELRDWRRMQPQSLADEAALQFTAVQLKAGLLAGHETAWNDSRDGIPYLVELKFGEPQGHGSVAVAHLLAGLDPQQRDAGRALLSRGLAQTQQGPQAPSQSLLDGLNRLKVFVSTQNTAGAVRRLNLIVTEDRLQFLVTQHRATPNGGRGG